jgi:hypothetical protein
MSDSKEQAKKAKNKKINRMTKDELEKAIEKTKQSQGNLNSRYGKELLKRKETNLAK